MFLYDMNETMKMLGYQCSVGIIKGAPSDDFDNVLTAHRQCGSGLLDLGIDMFMLGYIYGKRVERVRRKKVG